MSEYVTKTELRSELKSAMKEQTDEIVGVLHTFMRQADERFTGVEKRLDGLEYRQSAVLQRLDTMETRLDSLDAKYGHLVSTIDSFIARIDKYETELLIRDSQFERLLTWARKVSEKTGIPLENL